MKNINLTTVLTSILLIATFSWGVRQCSDKRDLKKVAFSYEKCLQESTMSEYKLTQYHKAKEKVIRDSLIYYKDKTDSYRQQANQNKARIRAYKSHIETLSDSITKLSPEISLGYLNANFIPGGEEVMITEDQVKGIHEMDLVRIDQDSIISNQGTMVELLDNSLEECMKGSYLAVTQLDECQVDNVRKDLKIRSQKRKVFNRTLFGGVMTGLLIIAVL